MYELASETSQGLLPSIKKKRLTFYLIHYIENKELNHFRYMYYDNIFQNCKNFHPIFASQTIIRLIAKMFHYKFGRKKSDIHFDKYTVGYKSSSIYVTK